MAFRSVDGESSVDAGIVIDLSPINFVKLQPDGLVCLGLAAQTVEIIDALRPASEPFPAGPAPMLAWAVMRSAAATVS